MKHNKIIYALTCAMCLYGVAQPANAEDAIDAPDLEYSIALPVVTVIAPKYNNFDSIIHPQALLNVLESNIAPDVDRDLLVDAVSDFAITVSTLTRACTNAVQRAFNHVADSDAECYKLITAVVDEHNKIIAEYGKSVSAQQFTVVPGAKREYTRDRKYYMTEIDINGSQVLNEELTDIRRAKTGAKDTPLQITRAVFSASDNAFVCYMIDQEDEYVGGFKNKMQFVYNPKKGLRLEYGEDYDWRAANAGKGVASIRAPMMKGADSKVWKADINDGNCSNLVEDGSKIPFNMVSKLYIDSALLRRAEKYNDAYEKLSALPPEFRNDPVLCEQLSSSNYTAINDDLLRYKDRAEYLRGKTIRTYEDRQFKKETDAFKFAVDYVYTYLNDGLRTEAVTRSSIECGGTCNSWPGTKDTVFCSFAEDTWKDEHSNTVNFIFDDICDWF